MNVFAVQPNDPPWLKRAFADRGITEISGAGTNPRITEMFALAGHPQVVDDETAWCAAAMGAWLVESGLKPSGQLTARSYELGKFGAEVFGAMKRGAILVFKRSSSTWQGHVCILLQDEGETLLVIGGNQKNKVSILRYKKDGLISAVWPSDAQDSYDEPHDEPEEIEPGEEPSVQLPVPAPKREGVGSGIMRWLRSAKTWLTMFTGGGFLGTTIEPKLAYIFLTVLGVGATCTLIYFAFIRNKIEVRFK